MVGQGWRPAAFVPPAPAAGDDGWFRRRRGSRVEVRGRVHGLNQSADGKDTVYAFRVDTYDDRGALRSCPVEMRSKRFRGLLNEGDLVQFSATMREDETARVRRLRNLTAGGVFRGLGNSARDRVMFVAGIPGIVIYAVVQVLFFVGFVAVLGLVVQALFGGG